MVNPKEKVTDNMENEQQLLKSARELDEKALLDIFDTFAPQVYVRVLHVCHDPGQADNIVSQVFERLLDELAKGKGPNKNLEKYLYQSADRLVKNN